MKGTMSPDEVMSKNLIAINDKSPLVEAFDLMQAKKVRHLLVKDHGGNLVGILSDRDVARASRSEVVEIMGVRSTDMALDSSQLVRHYMSSPVQTVSMQHSLRDVTLLMINQKISAVAITDGYDVKGIITTTDLLKVLAELLRENPSLGLKVESLFTDSIWGPIAHNMSQMGI